MRRRRHADAPCAGSARTKRRWRCRPSNVRRSAPARAGPTSHPIPNPGRRQGVRGCSRRAAGCRCARDRDGRKQSPGSRSPGRRSGRPRPGWSRRNHASTRSGSHRPARRPGCAVRCRPPRGRSGCDSGVGRPAMQRAPWYAPCRRWPSEHSSPLPLQRGPVAAFWMGASLHERNVPPVTIPEHGPITTPGPRTGRDRVKCETLTTCPGYPAGNSWRRQRA